MTKFTILFLVAQALLIQSAMSQCLQSVGVAPALNLGLGNYGSCGCGGALNNAGLNSAILSSGALNSGYGSYAGYGSSSGYGGSGTGQIAADGALDVAGYSNVYGNLPVTGLVQFSGNLPAGGTVTVLGNTPSICDCGCNYY